MMPAPTALGETEKERAIYANGIRMGFFMAAQSLREAGEAAGEKVGAAPCGPFLNSANYIEARMPKGIVESHHVVK